MCSKLSESQSKAIFAGLAFAVGTMLISCGLFGLGGLPAVAIITGVAAGFYMVPFLVDL